jgi:ubiquinone/menaquinone biosynthesis C-methylase UbiE/uncharacterized protein YbaR (Trm112 family)
MDDLLDLLACPGCLEGDLLGLHKQEPDRTIGCGACGAEYEVRGGVPVLLPPDYDPAEAHDELDHALGHKQRQAGWFDRSVAEEFEASRPHGTPRAYRWLLTSKLRRSLEYLPPVRGATVVDACCGSGMEAEFLARQGARVIAVDISEGAAGRARARARRFGLDYLTVVGDVERLPVRTRAAHFAYVHDGLHHLPDPMVGIRELARVAQSAFSVNEPADAVLTRAAVLLGLSTDEEEAGNAVRRLCPSALLRELQGSDWDVRIDRYLMYYRHEPAAVMRLLSLPGVFPIYRQLVETTNLAVGRWGNKLCLVGLRPGAGPPPSRR